MRALRAEHQKDMQRLVRTVRRRPKLRRAQAALQTLRQSHWNDMKALFKKYGIKVPAAPARVPAAGPAA